MSNHKNIAASKNPEKDYKGRTVYILYIPGGAMLGIIPAVMLSRLEELAETPSPLLFQVMNGVSTGSLIVGGMNIRSDMDHTKPRYIASNITELFCYWGNKFFPFIPGRMQKFVTASVLNYLQENIDPSVRDKLLIQDIREKVKDLSACHNTKPAIIQELIELRKLASTKYLNKRMQKKAARLCEKLIANKDLDSAKHKELEHINRLILARHTKGFMATKFNQAANVAITSLKNHWAKNYMHDPKTLENMLKDHLGDKRMSDALTSLYISSYNLQTRRMETFYARKKDFFNLSPDAECETSEHNEKIWDAIMASAANPFAFPPHTLESGKVCSDKAIIHNPMPCVEDVVQNVPKGVNVKLIYMGTGRSEFDYEQEKYVGFGVPGLLMSGQELSDLERYSTTAAKDMIKKKIGDENFKEFNPILTPSRYEEMQRLPSGNPLDASSENIAKILNAAKDYIQKEEVDKELKALALEMVTNLHALGRVSDAKLERVRKRCGDNSPANDNLTPKIKGKEKGISGFINRVIKRPIFK
jgi:patatin-like phospholipase/acyl hydrolase